MELLWADICHSAPNYYSPIWHRVLNGHQVKKRICLIKEKMTLKIGRSLRKLFNLVQWFCVPKEVIA